MNITERDELIRQRAYALWEASGRQDGQHEAHWQQASEEMERTETDTTGTPEAEGSGALRNGLTDSMSAPQLAEQPSTATDTSAALDAMPATGPKAASAKTSPKRPRR